MIAIPKSFPYRADIDGLRALAVISVVLFHFFPELFPGGFVGVDIFFVISGFLISGIIYQGFRDRKFSILNFYAHRVRRIFPALLTVLFTSYFLGWFLLTASEYAQLGKHGFSGAIFLSNYFFWYESGYFDNSAMTKPLLHLWSLGIEEQFYLVWPFILWATFYFRIRFILAVILITTISFALNIYEVYILKDLVKAFYSPQTRFWELMFGAALALVFQKNKNISDVALINSTISCCGVLLIAIGFILIRPVNAFPGAWALLPTIGAVLVIAAGSTAFVNRTILANSWMVKLGLISYPLYLWHWLIISYLFILSGGHLSTEVRMQALVVSLVLAIATYIFIEKPIRYGQYKRLYTGILFIGMSICALAGAAIFYEKGFDSRAQWVEGDRGFDGGFAGLETECKLINVAHNKNFVCMQDKREDPVFAVLGDSKAGVLFAGLFRTSLDGGRWAGFTSREFPLIPIISDSPLYKNVPKDDILIAINEINQNKKIKKVLIATSTRGLMGLKTDYSIDDLPASLYFPVAVEGLDRVVTKFIGSEKKVYLLVDNPTLAHKEDCINRSVKVHWIDQIIATISHKRNCSIKYAEHIEISKNYRNVLFEIERRHPNKVVVIDANELLCDPVSGVCSHEMDGKSLYGISDHISDAAGGMLGLRINKIMSHD